MPFPPGPTTASADDTPFDLSNTLHRIATLQSQLATNVQSAHLLRRQIKREQKALKQDRAELAALEKGLRGSNDLRRKKERGLHPVARRLDVNEDADSDADTETQEDIDRVNTIAGISTTAAAATTTDGRLGSSAALDPETDPDLEPLLKELRNHLLSMQNNVAGMAPVMAAIDETKTALDLFVARKLDPDALKRLYSAQISS
jgi:chromosome segregation ATPase